VGLYNGRNTWSTNNLGAGILIFLHLNSLFVPNVAMWFYTSFYDVNAPHVDLAGSGDRPQTVRWTGWMCLYSLSYIFRKCHSNLPQ